MEDLIKTRKIFLENQITDLNRKYILGNISNGEKEIIRAQLSRYGNELMKLNNAIILNKPIKIKEKPNNNLSLVTNFKKRNG